MLQLWRIFLSSPFFVSFLLLYSQLQGCLWCRAPARVQVTGQRGLLKSTWQTANWSWCCLFLPSVLLFFILCNTYHRANLLQCRTFASARALGREGHKRAFSTGRVKEPRFPCITFLFCCVPPLPLCVCQLWGLFSLQGPCHCQSSGQRSQLQPPVQIFWFDVSSSLLLLSLLLLLSSASWLCSFCDSHRDLCCGAGPLPVPERWAEEATKGPFQLEDTDPTSTDQVITLRLVLSFFPLMLFAKLPGLFPASGMRASVWCFCPFELFSGFSK